MSPEDAAYIVARIAWPNERIGNLRGWCPRLIDEAEMLDVTQQQAWRKHQEQAELLREAMQVLREGPVMTTCGLCTCDFTPDGEAARLIHRGREVVVCPTCSRLEGD